MWIEKGYKRTFRWPQGVRLPVMISVHHQSEEATCPMPDGQPDPFDFSERQYGARRGAWRLLEIMSKHGVRGTWLICGATLEKHPEVSRAVQQAGHCIAGHTYAHEMMCNLPPHTEVALIKKPSRYSRICSVSTSVAGATVLRATIPSTCCCNIPTSNGTAACGTTTCRR